MKKDCAFPRVEEESAQQFAKGQGVNKVAKKFLRSDIQRCTLPQRREGEEQGKGRGSDESSMPLPKGLNLLR